MLGFCKDIVGLSSGYTMLDYGYTPSHYFSNTSLCQIHIRSIKGTLMTMTSYIQYNGVTHYSTNDVYESDCYFICEFEHSTFNHSAGFSNQHRNTLPLVYSTYPTCLGCLYAMIQSLEFRVEDLTSLQDNCYKYHSS